MHGHRPEWIVFDFFDGAKRVNIASLSVNDSLEIANRIASTYFGKPCEYENESKVTYPKQLEQFLRVLKDGTDRELTWVELVVGNTPLEGSVGMRLTDSRSIGPAVVQFERAVGSLLSSIDAIESLKVLYCKKRVSLILEKLTDEEYVIRYSDQRLNPLQRMSFERYMRSTYEIPVLSTEKRFKHQP